MIPRERVLAALDRKPADRVPYVEMTIGVGIGEKLLNRKTPLVSIPKLGLTLRNVEDEKVLSRLLQRDNISFSQFTGDIGNRFMMFFRD